MKAKLEDLTDNILNKLIGEDDIERNVFISIDDSNNVVIVKLPKEFKSHKDLFNSQEYEDFVKKKWKVEDEKAEEERKKTPFNFNSLFQNGIIMSSSSGKGRSFFGYVEEFVNVYNIKQRKIKIDKILNK